MISVQQPRPYAFLNERQRFLKEYNEPSIDNPAIIPPNPTTTKNYFTVNFFH